MRQDINHSAGAAGQASLASDFALIGQAIADAFRGIARPSRLESRCVEVALRGAGADDDREAVARAGPQRQGWRNICS